MSLPASLIRFVERATTATHPTGAQRIVRGFLATASVGYGAIIRLRNAAYAAGLFPCHRLPCRVICVGNITTGGTGKTPTVILLVRALQRAGERPAVVLRGYGRRGRGAAVVSDGGRTLVDWREGGDEAALLAQALSGVPVVVGGDRVAAGQMALQTFRPTTVVLDDGFQHRRLSRDLDLVLLDGADPFGGEWLLPRGRLREPVGSLVRAHAILVTRADCAQDPDGLRRRLRTLAPGRPIGWAVHRPTGLRDLETQERFPVTELRHRSVHALCALGNPDAFTRTLRDQGPTITGSSVFADHHAFTRGEAERVVAAARREGATSIVTTTKDAVRLAEHLPLGMRVLALEIEVEVIDGAEVVGRAMGISLAGESRG